MTARARTPRPGGHDDRRESRRVPAGHVPDLKARLVGGPEVALINISRHGALFETDMRLLPGSPIAIRFITTDTTLSVRGSVIRSSVAVVSGTGMKYHTAVALKEALVICDDVFTRDHDEPGAAAPARAPAFEGLTLVATVAQTSQELQEQLGGNDW